MENASKALLMAGGVLIIIILISLVVLMHGEIGSYQQSKYDAEKTKELETFNKQFTGYESQSVYGYELISLINKVVDYNANDTEYNKNGFEYKEITINISMGSGNNTFAKKYGTNGVLKEFTKNKYTITKDDIDFYNNLKKYSDMETTANLKVLNLLSANYDAIVAWEKCGKDTKKDTTGMAKSPSDITGGLVANDKYSSSDIAKWREYSEFKKATFTCNNVSYYDNGQIKQLDFTFTK